MTVTVQFDPIVMDAAGETPVPADLIEQAAAAVLDIHPSPEASKDYELTIVISGDETIQALNRDYLDTDKITDVLSFPAMEDDPETGNRYLGDVIISYPQAKRQAEAGEHAVEAELQLLVVHGVLHLLGHDHAEPAEKTTMWERQAEILTSIGCALRPD